MKNPFKNLLLSKEVRKALAQSREAANHAMEAQHTIESIYVTEQLAAMFWKEETDVAEALKEDYYTELLIGKMLWEKEQEEAQSKKETPVTA